MRRQRIPIRQWRNLYEHGASKDGFLTAVSERNTMVQRNTCPERHRQPKRRNRHINWLLSHCLTNGGEDSCFQRKPSEAVIVGV